MNASSRVCPQGHGALTVVPAGSIEVDRCPHCGGVFFDPGELAATLGAYMVLFPKTKLHVVVAFVPLKVPAALYLLLWAALQVLGYLRHTPGIAWLAHVGGFLVGLAAAGISRFESRAQVAS